MQKPKVQYLEGLVVEGFVEVLLAAELVIPIRPYKP